MRKYIVSALCGVVAIASFSTASAAITFEFGTVVTGNPLGGPIYGTLLIEDAGLNTVNLTMSNTADPNVTAQFIHRLFLNVDPFVAGVVVSADPRLESYNFSQDGINDVGRMFDLGLYFSTQNGMRVLPGDSLLMTATGTGLTEDSFNNLSVGDEPNYLALMHINSIGFGEDRPSAKVAPPVPEPTTFAALGLGALAFFRRRRK